MNLLSPLRRSLAGAALLALGFGPAAAAECTSASPTKTTIPTGEPDVGFVSTATAEVPAPEPMSAELARLRLTEIRPAAKRVGAPAPRELSATRAASPGKTIARNEGVKSGKRESRVVGSKGVPRLERLVPRPHRMPSPEIL